MDKPKPPKKLPGYFKRHPHEHPSHWIGPKFQLPIPRDVLEAVRRLAGDAEISAAEWIREAVRQRLGREVSNG